MDIFTYAIYAICKNEIKNVNDWIQHIIDTKHGCDTVTVMDTGSTDGTLSELERFKSSSVNVYRASFNPFRFDHARNSCLSLVPHKPRFCIRLDLDERLPHDWRSILDSVAKDESVTRVGYKYIWSWTKDNKPDCQLYMDLIHNRHGYYFADPTHERLVPPANEKIFNLGDRLEIKQYPDDSVKHPDMELLELAVKENRSARNLFYYGRELHFAGQYGKCISILTDYAKVSDFQSELANAHRLIGNSYRFIKQFDKSYLHLMQSCRLDPILRDNWLALVRLAYQLGDWNTVMYGCLEAFKVKSRTFHYQGFYEPWGYVMHDYAALAHHNLGMNDRAIIYGRVALSKAVADKENEATISRLKKNLTVYGHIFDDKDGA